MGLILCFFCSPLPRLDRVDRLTAWTGSRDGFAVDCALQRRVRSELLPFRPPFEPKPEDGSPECWRAEASWTGGFIGSPARRCDTHGHKNPTEVPSSRAESAIVCGRPIRVGA